LLLLLQGKQARRPRLWRSEPLASAADWPPAAVRLLRSVDVEPVSVDELERRLRCDDLVRRPTRRPRGAIVDALASIPPPVNFARLMRLS
jgi:hypothetical protein